MPLARRKKTVVFDEASFTITPLTYNQLEEYAEMVKETANADLSNKETARKARGHVFFVIRCGLNNLPQAEPVTDEQLLEGIDDVLAGKLWRAIMEFTGIKLASDEELQRLVEERGKKKIPEGEAVVSS